MAIVPSAPGTRWSVTAASGGASAFQKASKCFASWARAAAGARLVRAGSGVAAIVSTIARICGWRASGSATSAAAPARPLLPPATGPGAQSPDLLVVAGEMRRIVVLGNAAVDQHRDAAAVGPQRLGQRRLDLLCGGDGQAPAALRLGEPGEIRRYREVGGEPGPALEHLERLRA